VNPGLRARRLLMSANRLVPRVRAFHGLP
jgi:hypothetical protein